MPLPQQTSNINSAFDDPFFSGFDTGIDTGLVPWALPVSIQSHPYLIDLKQYRRTTMQIRRLSTDQTVEPGEQTLNAAGLWPRAQDNWFIGAGQEFLDNRFDFITAYVHSGEMPSIRTRFWRSKGLNISNETALTLLPEYHRVYNGGMTHGNVDFLPLGTHIYVCDGTVLKYTAAPLTTSSTFTTVTGTSGTIHSMTTDGHRLWIACGSGGVFVTTEAASSATAAATPAQMPPVAGISAVLESGGTVGPNLAASTLYQYYITKVDVFGNETGTSSGSAAVVTEGAAPTPIDLAWNPDSNAQTYNVYRDVSGTFELLVSGLESPAYTDDGSLVPNSGHVLPSTNQTGSTAYPATYIQYVKGHLLASTGVDIVEILASGQPFLIYTHPNPGFVWNVFADTPSAIIACGNAGAVAEIHAIQPDSTTLGATLASPTWASTLPEGENIHCLAYSAGTIIMGTSLGVRTGTTPDSTGAFDVNPVIEDPASTLCLAPYLQYCYFGWNIYDATDVTNTDTSVTTGLGKMDLSQYSNTGVPAYATDVMTADNEYGGGTTTSVHMLGAVPYFTVQNSDIWAPSGNVVQSGFIESGWVRYGTMENKILVNLDLHHDPLAHNQTIQVNITDQFGNNTFLGVSETPGSVKPAFPFQTNLAVGERFMVIVQLNRGITTDVAESAQTPTLRYWRSQALVVPPRQDEIIVPIIMKDTIATIDTGSSPYELTPYDEFVFLKGLEQSGAPLIYIEMGISYTCYIDQIEIKPEKWSDDRNFFGGTVNVKLITLSPLGA